MIEFPRRNGRWGLCSRPSPGSGFYLYKDFGAAEVGILSTQRVSRGRDLDFIYATNFARPGVRCWSAETLYGELSEWQCIEENECYSENNFSAACACSSEVIETQRVDICRPTKLYVRWCVLHTGDEVDENRHLNEKWMMVHWHFKTFLRCARLGAMLRKCLIPEMEYTFTC